MSVSFFRLTVTDSDGAQNSTFANVTVIKGERVCKESNTYKHMNKSLSKYSIQLIKYSHSSVGSTTLHTSRS